MRRTTFRTIASTAAALMLTSGALTAHGASTTTDDTDGDYPAEMLAAMESDLGLSADRAKERLDFQAEASEIQAQLDKELGDDFAGTWLDAESDEVFVATTDRGRSGAVRDQGARAVVVEHSLEQLSEWTDELTEALDGVDGVPGLYIDVEANGLVVQVHDGATRDARQAVRDTDVPRQAVTYEVTDEEPELYNQGGDAYYIGSGGRCSIGFAVQGGFVTAGHCGSTGASTSSPTGSFAASHFPGDDMAWVRTSATVAGTVNNYSGGSVAVHGASPASVGAQVCRSGSTTGWHCGTIQAFNATVTYPQGTVRGLIRTTVCAEPGDSGGSLLAGNQAQGVTSGGSGNCRTGGTTFFQPVQPILQRYGLSLITTGGNGGGNPPPAACSGTSYQQNGSLASGNTAVHPSGSYFQTTGTRTIRACVAGPSGTDFDVYLQRWSGSAWTTVSQGTTPSNVDELTYTASAGYYRVIAHAYSGSGSYTVGISVS